MWSSAWAHDAKVLNKQSFYSSRRRLVGAKNKPFSGLRERDLAKGLSVAGAFLCNPSYTNRVTKFLKNNINVLT